ncbi:MAG: kinase [Cyanobacteria bacterium QH_7_48_89]|nr:MAG: kinase [Cyanobacteria bacterium QH_7_48_89]
MSLTCHFLIGPPSSGKSSFARQLAAYHAEQDSQAQIVSTDAIRADLYGSDREQGHWPEIEAQLLIQVREAIDLGEPVIYDATNAKRAWRMQLLQKLGELEESVRWIGWQLTPSLKTCKHWNSKRDRQVPEQAIENLHRALRQFPPRAGEGLTALIQQNPLQADHAAIEQKLRQLPRRIANRQNRAQQYEPHCYSGLLDFDRLMQLLALLLRYPGLGQLRESDPEQLQLALDADAQTLPQFDSAIEEIAAVMHHQGGAIYAHPEALAADLDWLGRNGLLVPFQVGVEAPFELEPATPIQEPHFYADVESFTRLMAMLRFILHHPFSCRYEADEAPNGNGTRARGSLQSLVEELVDAGALYGKASSGHRRSDLLNNHYNNLRKDIERALKPFGLLPELAMRHGYFAGTGILSASDLKRVYRLLSEQVKHLDDPVSHEILETFQARMQQSGLGAAYPYPVRTMGNRPIVNRELLPEGSTAKHEKSINLIEAAIESAELLQLRPLHTAARYRGDERETFEAWPVQIAFHNIAWYLGYQRESDGLFRFERLDRLVANVRRPTRQRTSEEWHRALEQLQQLYHSSFGIYLGRSPEDQQAYLSKDPQKRASVESKLELWFQEDVFQFVREGTARLPDSQLRMTAQQPSDARRSSIFQLKGSPDGDYPQRLVMTLPRWSLQDFDLKRWILGYTGQVKVASPPQFAEQVRRWGSAIAGTYEEADAGETTE